MESSSRQAQRPAPRWFDVVLGCTHGVSTPAMDSGARCGSDARYKHVRQRRSMSTGTARAQRRPSLVGGERDDFVERIVESQTVATDKEETL